MAFEKVCKMRGYKKLEKSGCCVRLYIQHKGEQACPFMLVTFRKDVVEKMGWTVGDRVMMFLGEGRDEGKIRVELCDDDNWNEGYTLFLAGRHMRDARGSVATCDLKFWTSRDQAKLFGLDMRNRTQEVNYSVSGKVLEIKRK